MKFVDRFDVEHGYFESTYIDSQSNVVSLCRYKDMGTHLSVDWIHSNDKRKGYASVLLIHLSWKYNKPVLPYVIFTPEAESFWAFFLLGQLKNAKLAG